jgi:hypothetical protein
LSQRKGFSMGAYSSDCGGVVVVGGGGGGGGVVVVVTTPHRGISGVKTPYLVSLRARSLTQPMLGAVM